MSYETGMIKYMIKTPLSIAGFISMYLFGSVFLSVVSALNVLLQGGSFIDAVAVYLITEYLPPTSIEGTIIQVAMGSVIAGLLWYKNVPKLR